MGTTLTGTTPQDTYDSLIKVTDNGPLSGTAKYLSDGLGNDSVLALSTSRVGIGTTSGTRLLELLSSGADLAVIGTSGSVPKLELISGGVVNWSLRTNQGAASDFTIYQDATERLRISSGGNVGIGTSAPSEPLVVSSLLRDYTSAQFSTLLQSTTAQSVGRGGSLGFGGETGGGIIAFGGIIGAKENSTFAETGGYLAFTTRANGGPLTEKVRILSSGGITFNGDTAAANALDDYEEGTFTGTLRGSTSDPSTAVTATGYYTKIGNRVTASIAINNANTTGAAGEVTITGLPFTSNANNSSQGSMVSNTYDLNTAAFVSALMGGSSTTISFLGTKDDADWVDLLHNAGAGRSIRCTITYFV